MLYYGSCAKAKPHVQMELDCEWFEDIDDIVIFYIFSDLIISPKSEPRFFRQKFGTISLYPFFSRVWGTCRVQASSLSLSNIYLPA